MATNGLRKKKLLTSKTDNYCDNSVITHSRQTSYDCHNIPYQNVQDVENNATLEQDQAGQNLKFLNETDYQQKQPLKQKHFYDQDHNLITIDHQQNDLFKSHIPDSVSNMNMKPTMEIIRKDTDQSTKNDFQPQTKFKVQVKNRLREWPNNAQISGKEHEKHKRSPYIGQESVNTQNFQQTIQSSKASEGKAIRYHTPANEKLGKQGITFPENPLEQTLSKMKLSKRAQQIKIQETLIQLLNTGSVQTILNKLWEIATLQEQITANEENNSVQANQTNQTNNQAPLMQLNRKSFIQFTCLIQIAAMQLYPILRPNFIRNQHGSNVEPRVMHTLEDFQTQTLIDIFGINMIFLTPIDIDSILRHIYQFIQKKQNDQIKRFETVQSLLLKSYKVVDTTYMWEDVVIKVFECMKAMNQENYQLQIKKQSVQKTQQIDFDKNKTKELTKSQSSLPFKKINVKLCLGSTRHHKSSKTAKPVVKDQKPVEKISKKTPVLGSYLKPQNSAHARHSRYVSAVGEKSRPLDSIFIPKNESQVYNSLLNTQNPIKYSFPQSKNKTQQSCVNLAQTDQQSDPQSYSLTHQKQSRSLSTVLSKNLLLPTQDSCTFLKRGNSAQSHQETNSQQDYQVSRNQGPYCQALFKNQSEPATLLQSQNQAPSVVVIFDREGINQSVTKPVDKQYTRYEKQHFSQPSRTNCNVIIAKTSEPQAKKDQSEIPDHVIEKQRSLITGSFQCQTQKEEKPIENKMLAHFSAQIKSKFDQSLQKVKDKSMFTGKKERQRPQTASAATAVTKRHEANQSFNQMLEYTQIDLEASIKHGENRQHYKPIKIVQQRPKTSFARPQTAFTRPRTSLQQRPTSSLSGNNNLTMISEKKFTMTQPKNSIEVDNTIQINANKEALCVGQSVRQSDTYINAGVTTENLKMIPLKKQKRPVSAFRKSQVGGPATTKGQSRTYYFADNLNLNQNIVRHQDQKQKNLFTNDSVTQNMSAGQTTNLKQNLYDGSLDMHQKQLKNSNSNAYMKETLKSSVSVGHSISVGGNDYELAQNQQQRKIIMQKSAQGSLVDNIAFKKKQQQRPKSSINPRSTAIPPKQLQSDAHTSQIHIADEAQVNNFLKETIGENSDLDYYELP